MADLGTDYKTLLALLDPATLSGALLLFAVFGVVGIVLSVILRRTMHAIYARDRDGRLDRLSMGFLSKFAQVFLWLVVAMLYAHAIPALAKLGTALLASVSVASIVIGLAAQSTLANLVAGVSLILYRPFKLGDRLEIGVPAGVETGIVEDVSLGYSVLRTPDNRRIVLSNSTMANAVMINHTRTDPRVIAKVPFSIGYDADIDKARSIALRLAEDHADVREVTGCPVVCLNASSVDFMLMLWCADASAAWKIKCDLLESIKTGFDAAGIEIPYAYQNILLKGSPEHRSAEGTAARETPS